MRINAVSFKGGSTSSSMQNSSPNQVVKSDCAGGGCKKLGFGDAPQFVDKRQYDLAIAQLARLNKLLIETKEATAPSIK